MIIEQTICILEWFLKDHDTEDWSNAAEISALQHMKKLRFQIYIHIEKKRCFKL